MRRSDAMSVRALALVTGVVSLSIACGGSTPPPRSTPPAPVASRPIAAPATYRNPVVGENCPDPGVLRHGGWFWTVCTTNGNRTPDKFPIRRTRDLVHWERVGHIFPAGARTWAVADFWAPEIIPAGDRFLAYYTGRDASGTLAIGVAVAPAIAGPWTDTGAPLVRDPRVGMIDPHAFVDDDGARYLYWKADGNGLRPAEPATIFVQRLSSDGLARIGRPTEILRNDAGWEGDVIEGGSVVKRGGFYYLIYSGNAFNSARYAVGVARARSPLGPFEKRPAPILVSNDAFDGPGHGSLVRVGGDDFYVYHAWRHGQIDRTWNRPRFPRVMLVDRIRWRDGWPTIHDGTPSVGPIGSPLAPPSASAAAAPSGAVAGAASSVGAGVDGDPWSAVDRGAVVADAPCPVTRAGRLGERGRAQDAAVSETIAVVAQTMNLFDSIRFLPWSRG
jgi:beta-xylosidase